MLIVADLGLVKAYKFDASGYFVVQLANGEYWQQDAGDILKAHWNKPAATYKVQITAIGYASDPRADVRLTDDEKASFDFALRKTKVRWSDLSTYQGRRLLPKPRGMTSPIRTLFSRPVSSPATRSRPA